MVIIRVTLGLWLSLILSSAAFAKPLEVRSENFVLYGNIGEGSAKTLINELEEYRAAILQRMGASQFGPEIIPVRIYIADGPKEIEKLTGAVGAGGVYRTSLEGPVFVLNSRSGFRRGNKARAIALHEYTHHLLASFTNTTYPRWYDEGLAEYLSTFKTNKKGHIIIGQPDQDHAYTLKNIDWFPVERMLSAVRRYPYPNDNSRNTQIAKSIFYAQSWLAVHYIQSTPGYPKKFAAYSKLLNAANTPENAFETAFGMTPADFGKELKTYYKRNRYLSVTIALPETRPRTEISVRDMGKAELAFHMAEAIRHFEAHEAGYEKASDYYEKASENPALQARINVSKAQFLGSLGKVNQAVPLIETALAANPNDTELNRVAGMLWVRQYADAPVPDEKKLKKARKTLNRAMQLNPDNVPAHFYYATSFVDSYSKPSKQAVASAQTSLDYYRSVNFVESNMALAQVLMKADEAQEAVPALQKAVAWSRSRSRRTYARRQLERLQAVD